MTKQNIQPNTCEFPFNSIHISDTGETYCCCQPWCNYYSFGNILKSSFKEIWLGRKATEFRKQFKTNEYRYCNMKTCLPYYNEKINLNNEDIIFPKNIGFQYDYACNVNCIFCNIKQTKQPHNIDEITKRIKEIAPELFTNAKRLLLQGSGEALASKYSREIIKEVATLYPTVKFDLITNGILANEENFKELNITDKIGRLFFSIHATKKKTYNKLVKNGNFNQILKNIEYAYSLLKENKLESLEFRFVITSINYKEMIQFAHFAKKYSAYVTFINLIEHDRNNNIYKQLNVIDKNHPDYNNFIDVLKDPIFKEDFVSINRELFDKNKIPFSESIKNKFKNFWTKEYKITF